MFVLVMPDTDLDAAREVAERVRQSLATADVMSLDGQRVAVSVSIGVAQLTPATGDATGLVQRAALALLRAKDSGRDRVESFI